MSQIRPFREKRKRLAAPGSAVCPGWIHEIKHDNFRIMAQRDAAAYNFHQERQRLCRALPARRGCNPEV